MTTMLDPLSPARLYGILDLGYADPQKLAETTHLMVEGGVDVLQLRAKGHSEREILNYAEQIQPVLSAAGIPFILNDYPHLTKQAGADGVHVGQDDMSVDEVRDMLGEDVIVGKSTHSLDQAKAASCEAVDYLGFGPLMATPTKPEYQPIGVQDIRLVHELVGVPIFCIGGVKRENLPEILQAGAKRVVIVSGILNAPDIPAYIREVKEMLGA